jgi:hypothetical protein
MAKKKKKSFYEYTLLKQLLPEEFLLLPNPLHFLLTAISYKHFFSTLFRTINEEPRIHHFDTHLSSFELKLWFGWYQASSLASDHYYCYAILAHLNAHHYYAPTKVIAYVQMIMLARFAPILAKKNKLIVLLSETLQLWLLSFLYQVKQIPQSSPQEEMRWCVESFFSLRQQQLISNGYENMTDSSKKKCLEEGLEYFFLMSYAAKRFSEYLPYGRWANGLWSYLQNRTTIFDTSDITQIVSWYHQTSSDLSWTDLEIAILVKSYNKDSYLMSLIQKYPKNISEHFFAILFSQWCMHEQLHAMMTGKLSFSSFMQDLMDPDFIKKRFVAAARSLWSRIQQKHYNPHEEEALDEFFESRETGKLNIFVTIPESLKKESELMNLLLHFYLHTVMTCFQYYKEYKHFIWAFPFLSSLDISLHDAHYYTDEKTLLQSIVHQYSACSFYYEQAYSKIVSGLERFTIPLVPHANRKMPDIKIFQEIYHQHLPVLYQDFNHNLSTQKAIKSEATLFQHYFWDDITLWLQKSSEALVSFFYGELLSTDQKMTLIQTQSLSILSIKESLYSLDFRLWQSMSQYIQSLPETKTIKNHMMSTISHAIVRNTLLWVIIFWSYVDVMSKQYEKRSFLFDIIAEVIVREIWFLPFASMRKVSQHIQFLLDRYRPLIELLMQEAETKKMCNLAYQSLQTMIETAPQGEMISIGHEDVVWFREYLQHLHYFSRKSYKPSF